MPKIMTTKYGKPCWYDTETGKYYKVHDEDGSIYDNPPLIPGHWEIERSSGNSVPVFIDTKGNKYYPAAYYNYRYNGSIYRNYNNGKSPNILDKWSYFVTPEQYQEIEYLNYNFFYNNTTPVFSLVATNYVQSQNYHDPLIFDLDGDGIETINLNNSNAYFDLDNDGFNERSGWISADDGLLVFDKNNNGTIDDINELFGDTTKNGFEELIEYDSNSDGVIDVNDAEFSNIKIWQDVNENGISEAIQ